MKHNLMAIIELQNPTNWINECMGHTEKPGRLLSILIYIALVPFTLKKFYKIEAPITKALNDEIENYIHKWIWEY